MRNLKIFCISILFLLISCVENTEENFIESDSDTIQENPDWIRERFNSTYTIMFPDSYVGSIKEEVVGTTFSKKRNDGKVVVQGGFCDALAYPCMAADYAGEGIEGNIDSVSYTNLSGNPAYLNKKITIQKNQKDIGYFFYTDSSGGTFRDSYGWLYLNDISVSSIKVAGIIGFSSFKQEEVFEIIRSIKQE